MEQPAGDGGQDIGEAMESSGHAKNGARTISGTSKAAAEGAGDGWQGAQASSMNGRVKMGKQTEKIFGRWQFWVATMHMHVLFCRAPRIDLSCCWQITCEKKCRVFVMQIMHQYA